MNGRPLPRVRGGPVRVVVPGHIGARSVKWVRRISAQAQPSDSYFQAEDYRLLPADAKPAPGRGISLGSLNLTSAILSPDDGARLPAGRTDVTGYALAGERRAVARVDISLDGGQTWTQADVNDPPSPWAWHLWHTTLDLPPGRRGSSPGRGTTPARRPSPSSPPTCGTRRATTTTPGPASGLTSVDRRCSSTGQWWRMQEAMRRKEDLPRPGSR
jgi:DMSO/TMAO reductase YedYZ molybdopterin-dependent catalytic subunit